MRGRDAASGVGRGGPKRGDGRVAQGSGGAGNGGEEVEAGRAKGGRDLGSLLRCLLLERVGFGCVPLSSCVTQNWE